MDIRFPCAFRHAQFCQASVDAGLGAQRALCAGLFGGAYMLLANRALYPEEICYFAAWVWVANIIQHLQMKAVALHNPVFNRRVCPVPFRGYRCCISRFRLPNVLQSAVEPLIKITNVQDEL